MISLRGLALNFASTHQTENPRGFSEVGENEQLLIAVVVFSFLYCLVQFYIFLFGFSFHSAILGLSEHMLCQLFRFH